MIPTKSPIRETTSDITINVTITDPTLTEEEVVDNVNKSVKQYFNATFEEDIQYTLIVTVIKNVTVVRIAVFDVYILDTDNINEEINSQILQNEIEKDLETSFGEDATDVTVAVNTKDFTELYEQQTLFQKITLILGAGLLLIITVSYIDSKAIRKNDFHKIGSLFSASFHILDTWSDIFFAIQCTYHPDFGGPSSTLFVIFILAIVFILIPMVTTLYQLYSVANKHWNKNDDLRGWLSANLYILYMVSIICGSSFTGIELLRSNLFNLSIFDIPLTKQEALHFQTKKVYSTILLEVFFI